MKSILIVEDSTSISSILSQKLKEKYFDNFIAKSMKEAIYAIEKEGRDFFAAILDLNLPDARNGEIVDYILSKGIPSIVLSGQFNDDLYEIITNKDVIDFVIKNREEDIDYVVKVIDNISRYKYYKVLVVDDSTLSRDILKKHLNLLLFNVYEAKDGEEALKVLKENPDINLIVTDYHMPKMDGFELTLEIRKKYKKFEKVIIGETAHDSKDISAKFLKYGANGYLSKPFTKEEFNYTIHNSMEYVEQINKIEEQLIVIDKNINCSQTDLRGDIIYVSDAFLRESGYKRDELIGKSHNILRHPDTPAKIYRELWENIIDGKTWRGELKNINKNGEVYWVDVQVEPIFDRNRDIVAFNAIRRDITDQKQKEFQEQLLIKQARMNAMGEMLNLISHHWRQPLTKVSLILQDIEDRILLKEFDEDAVLSETSEGIKQIQEMSKVISYFMYYFQINEEKTELNLIELFDNIFKIMAPSFKDNKIGYDISININKKIYTFKNEFTQGVISILKNSLEVFQLRDIKEPKIKVYAYEDKDFAIIEISDNGGGIKEKDISKVFEPYFSTKEVLNGTGLGLYITKSIIEHHLKGKINATNIENGAKFTIKIPFAN